MFDKSKQPTNIVQIEPIEFKLPPHGNSKDEEFDPTVHLELEPEKTEKDGEEEDSDVDDGDVSFDSDGNPKPRKPKVYKLLAPTLWKTWLFISPDRSLILAKL